MFWWKCTISNSDGDLRLIFSQSKISNHEILPQKEGAVKSGLFAGASTSCLIFKQAYNDYFRIITSVCSFYKVNNDSVWQGCWLGDASV